MWNWIKKLFSRETQKPLVLKEQVKIDLSKTTKGDRKKLYALEKLQQIKSKEENNATN
jgi:hypothetical protein